MSTQPDHEARGLLERIASPRPLDQGDLAHALGGILRGEWSTGATMALLAALRTRGEDALMLATGARVLHAAMVPVEHDLPLVLDTCGTGGDGRHTLNLSTAVALLVAALGVPVAKHGNRAVSSRAGSADVAEALGFSLDRGAQAARDDLRQRQFTFLFAPAHHPALRHAAPARRELGLRSLFNFLGPMVNPARASHQLLGVATDAMRQPMAEALGALGVQRAWVVHAEAGYDEVVGPTRLSEWDGRRVVERRIAPADAGLGEVPDAALAGGDAQENALRIRQLLEGADDPARPAVLFGAAAALLLVGRVGDLRQGAELATRAIDQGQARDWLQRTLGARP